MATETGKPPRLALIASEGARAEDGRAALAPTHDWSPLEEADIAVVLGGDGFLLDVLHRMLDQDRVIPVYGINLGTVGFLMNRFKSSRPIAERIARARQIAVSPLEMVATTSGGSTHRFYAINEVSLLRETRQTAKLEVKINGKVRIPELVCDGVLVATPAGSTAYNLSANGPILPLGCKLVALTAISPFRPRRWRGAILEDKSQVTFRVLDAIKRPVAAVADGKEIRDIREVEVAIAPDRRLTLLFDPGSGLDERIFSEQFQV